MSCYDNTVMIHDALPVGGDYQTLETSQPKRIQKISFVKIK
jgi:hypothetical protein